MNYSVKVLSHVPVAIKNKQGITWCIAPGLLFRGNSTRDTFFQEFLLGC